ncbi:MAG: family 16 glycoside hydrolase [Mariniphaga sp.]
MNNIVSAILIKDMRKIHFRLLVLIIAFCSGNLLINAQTTITKPAVKNTSARKPGSGLPTKGKLLFEDNFKNPAEYTKEYQLVAEGWSVKAGHAKWEKSGNGVRSVWETGHMPVLVYQGSFGDAVIEVDFRFQKEEGKWAACRISAANTELNPRAYAASVWANSNNKGRALGMVLEHDEWKPGVITTVDTLMVSFQPDKWYTLRLELIGNHARASCNGVTVCGYHDLFGIPKNSISLGVGTCKHELRNFRVYEVISDPD